MRWVITLIFALATSVAVAQMFSPIGPGSIVPIGPSAGSGGVTPPGTPCTAGAFDLSLSTGCNLPFYLRGIFP